MPEAPRYQFGEFEFNAGTFELRRGTELRPLEPKALDVLRLLLDRAPDVVDKQDIFATVWKDVAVTDNALTRVVTQLRKALGDDAREPRYVATVSTRGYRLLEPVRRASPQPAQVDAPAEAGAHVPSGAHTPTTPPPADPATRSPFYVVAAIAVIAIAATGFWRYGQPATSSTARTAADLDLTAAASLTPIQITSSKGFDSFLAFSPDNTTIAYSSDRSGAMEIYVQGLAEGSTAVPLTANGRQNVHPVWSPDGQYLAFHEMVGDGIWIVPARGGAARKVTEFGSRPSWSPDGRRLVFQSQSPLDFNPGGGFGPTSTIWIADVDARTPPVALTTPGHPAGSHGVPAWWPDGQRIVFGVNGLATPRGGAALWTIDPDGSALQQLSAHETMSTEFAPSPDGKGVYFSPWRTHGIWFLPVSDPRQPAGEPRPTGLPVTGSSVASIAVSRNGRFVAWTAHDAHANVWATNAGEDATASPLVADDEVGWRAGYPVVSADGQVAFIGNRRNAGNQIFLVRPGASSRQLTTDAPDHGGPVWLQNGRGLAVISDHGTGPAYFSFDLETGRERLLFSLKDVGMPDGAQSQVMGPGAGLALSGDGSRLAGAFVQNGVPNVWTRAIGPHGPHGPFVQRSFEAEGASFPAWSPDGKWVAFQCNRDRAINLCVAAADSGPVTQLTHDPGEAFVGGWMDDNEHILFAARRSAVWNVYSASRETASAKAMTTFTQPRFYVRYPRWDPAARRIVFERFETAGTLWWIEIPER